MGKLLLSSAVCVRDTFPLSHTYPYVFLKMCLNSAAKMTILSAPSFTALFTIHDIKYFAKLLLAAGQRQVYKTFKFIFRFDP